MYQWRARSLAQLLCLSGFHSFCSHSADSADVHIENDQRAFFDANATAIELSWQPARTPEAVDSYVIVQRDRRSSRWHELQRVSAPNLRTRVTLLREALAAGAECEFRVGARGRCNGHEGRPVFARVLLEARDALPPRQTRHFSCEPVDPVEDSLLVRWSRLLKSDASISNYVVESRELGTRGWLPTYVNVN